MKTHLAAFATLSLLSTGCERSVASVFSCPFPDWTHVDHEGNPDPCHVIEPPVVPALCLGDCIPIGPAGFRREPLLLWTGDAIAVDPGCPAHAKGEYWTGQTGLVASPDCPLCTCGTSECVLPVGIAASPGPLCGGPTFTDLLASVPWDGSCTSPTTLDPGTFGSVVIPPPMASPCEVVEVPPPPKAGGDFSWTTRARACDGLVHGRCDQSDLMCSPTAKPPPPGFRQCIVYTDAVDENALPACPEAYPEQFVFYADVDDQRKCTPCDCGEPLGNQCIAAVSAYQDTACGEQSFALFENAAIALGQGTSCITTMAGGALGSMSASWMVNELGACVPSGGQPYGEAKPAKAKVFCCQGLPTQ